MGEKRKFKSSFIATLIIIASFFMAVGYSSINSIVLDLEGKVTIITTKKLHILDAEIVNENNASSPSLP